MSEFPLLSCNFSYMFMKYRDLEVALNKIVPGSWTRDGTFLHTMEGEDDMPGHVKSSLMGPSLNIPVSIYTLIYMLIASHCENP